MNNSGMENKEHGANSIISRLRETLSSAENPLIIGVGGGNDSVSTLFLKAQLEKDFGFSPQRCTVMATLPDCLDYTNTQQNLHPLIHEINAASERFIRKKALSQFPERILAQHQSQFGIEKVLGMSMTGGSEGIKDALSAYLAHSEHDLILALDVGGDFISVPENHHVLSPMMDGYMLYALRSIQASQDIPLIYGVFGLGTDGETPPHLLDEALAKIPERYDGNFDAQTLKHIAAFYRSKVEPNRYSRTADFTLKEIFGDHHRNPESYRARMHTHPSSIEHSNKYYGYFDHHFDPKYYGTYHLFDDLQDVHNPYELSCTNGVAWFLAIQDIKTRINHELIGQSYDLGIALDMPALLEKTIYFGTPSHKFSPEDIASIIQDVTDSIRRKVFDSALVFTEDIKACPDLDAMQVTPSLSLLTSDEDIKKALLPS